MNEIEKARNGKIQFGRDRLAGCLLALRKRFQEDPDVIGTIMGCDPAIDAKPMLEPMMEDLIPAYGEDVIDESLTILLEELEEQRAAPPSAYLVSTETGRTVCPISEDDIVTPPDYEGEDGKLHKATPIVHPRITSTMALQIQETERATKIRKTLADPTKKSAYEHLTNPQAIVQMTKDRLRKQGVEVVDSFGNRTTLDSTISFGHESVRGMEDSPNEQFHRAHMFSIILTKKVIDAYGLSPCAIGEIRSVQDSRQRWFEVDVSIGSSNGD